MWKTKIPYYFIDQQNNFIDINDNVIGVERISTGGGSGTWINIDRNGNRIYVQDDYFSKHSIYSSFRKITYTNKNAKSDEFIRIPKFYYKSDKNIKYWISSTKEEGFQVYPAFIKDNKEIDYIFIGKYSAKVIPNSSGNNVIFSCDINEVPSCNYSFNSFQEMIDYKNRISDLKGYHLINLYELGALQLLGLIEACSTDFQSYFGMGCCGLGNTKNSLYKQDLNDYKMVNVNTIYDGSNNNYNCDFHGIIGLWGNTWEFVDGIRVTPNTTLDKNNNTYINNYSLKIFNNTGVLQYSDELSETEKTINLAYIDTGIDMSGYNKDVSDSTTEGFACGTYNDILTGTGMSFNMIKGKYRTLTYNLSDVFIPDVKTINSELISNSSTDIEGDSIETFQKTGTYSDYMYRNKEDTVSILNQICAFGGTYEMKERAGIFAYNFNIKEDEIKENVSARLCRYPTE